MTEEGVRKTTPSLSDELDMALGEAGQPEVAAFLVGLSGNLAGKLFRVAPGESILGRTSKALVRLDEKAVSHRHAKLILDENGCRLTDLDSTNGTLVNDQKVTEARLLQAGDVIRIGHAVLGFLTDAEDAHQHTRALAHVTGKRQGFGETSAMTGAAEAFSAQVVPVPYDSIPAPGQLVRSVAQSAPLAPAQNPLDGILDKVDLVLGLFKRFWRVIVASALILGIGGAATMTFSPPHSTAEFEIFLRQDQVKDTTRHFATRRVEFFEFADKHFTDEALVRQTMLDMAAPVSPETVFGTSKALGFQRVGPGTFKGTYTHPRFDYAERFLARHLQNFLEEEIGKAIRVLRSEVELLRSQFQQNEAKLKSLEGELSDFKLENLDALPEHAADHISSKVGLLGRRDQLSSSLVRYQKELAVTQQQLSSEDAIVETKVARSQPYEAGLAEVRRDLAKARANGYSDGHPEVQRLLGEERELLELKERAINAETTEVDTLANAEYRRLSHKVGELQVLVASTQQELGLVEQRLAEIGEIAGNMPAVEADVSEKLRQVEAAKRLHDRLFEQLKAKELELDFERASVAARYEVIKAPHAWPVDPVASAVKRGVVGAVGGVFFGVFFAVVLFVGGYARDRRRRLAPSPSGG